MSTGCCIDREHCWLSWEEEDGEEVALLNFSEKFLDEVGWQIGDELEFIDQGDGSFLLKKAVEKGS